MGADSCVSCFFCHHKFPELENNTSKNRVARPFSSIPGSKEVLQSTWSTSKYHDRSISPSNGHSNYHSYHSTNSTTNVHGFLPELLIDLSMLPAHFTPFKRNICVPKPRFVQVPSKAIPDSTRCVHQIVVFVIPRKKRGNWIWGNQQLFAKTGFGMHSPSRCMKEYYSW